MNKYKLQQSDFQNLRIVLAQSLGSLISVGIFSIFVNLLMLTGPLFMLQVYDRVLASRSEETLIALLVLVAGLYGLMGVLDYARGRVSARVGADFQSKLDRRVFVRTLRINGAHLEEASSPLKDLEAVQRLLSSPAFFSMIDIPWAPLFIAMIFVFHPILGWLAVGGALLLITIALTNQFLSFRPVGRLHQHALASENLAENLRSQGELVKALGMEGAALSRWEKLRNLALDAQIKSSDITGLFSTLSKTLRLFLQSLVLALGAYLVLQGEITAGAMIAVSIILGRALAPVEQAIAQWPNILRAKSGWTALAKFLEQVPGPEEHTQLPKPRALLEVKQLVVTPPGSKVATLRLDGFQLGSGLALGVIGSSASGKSTLARALTGIWRPVSGEIRLDGAMIDKYGQCLGAHIGYLPQEVSLFDATVAENIARLLEAPDAEAVVKAAKKAGAHEMILKLSGGYDTVVSGGLSGGQKQRIGLARAMYGDPVLLVLDEPNACLDSMGSNALNAAIKLFKSEGGSIIIMAHRPSGITECDLLMVLQEGVRKSFGPRDEVLRAQVENHAEFVKTTRSLCAS